MRSIAFDPYIPWTVWSTMALAAAGLLAWYAVSGRNRVPGGRWWFVVALMSAAVIAPLAILLNPTWQEQIPPPPGKPLLTVLVDRSASMGVPDAGDGQTRFQAAAAMAAKTAKELGDRYEVCIRSFAEGSSLSSAETIIGEKPEGAATDIAAAVEEALSGDRSQGQAIVLLSDGIHNAQGGTERLRRSAAKAKAVDDPLFVKTFGGQAGVQDIEVALQQPQELAFIGQRVPVTVNVRQRGSRASRVELSLVADGKLVEKHAVNLKADDTAEDVFYVAHKINGLYRYEVRAEPFSWEVTPANNTASLLLRVVDQPVRVLLLEGKPYWDTKFLVRTLSMDQSIELVTVVQLAEGRLLERKIPRALAPGADDDSGKNPGAEKSPAAPNSDQTNPRPSDQWTIETDAGKFLSDAQSLASYQIVILGRGAEIFLNDDALVKLKKWLSEDEGSLVCFRGPPSSQIGQRLGDLMPLRWMPAAETRFHVQLTGAGQALRWLPAATDGSDPLADLPSLASAARGESTKALAVVLATGASSAGGEAAPVISYQPVGNGRVVAIEGAGMWRWAFLPPEKQQTAEIYATLWRSLVRWLAANMGLLPSQRLALRTDKAAFSSDENVSANLLIRQWSGDAPQVELSGTALDRPRLTACVPRGNYPGQYYVSWGRLPEGHYSARVAGIEKNEVSGMVDFDVQGNLAERLDVRAQPNLLKFLADQSGGAVLENVDPKMLARQFERHLSQSRPTRTAQTTAWDRWWVLLGAFGLWAAAWGYRRHGGLV
ncbi:MAG: hypothetical protein ABSA77_05890 [Thermoguttaceae bacterium]